MSELLPPPCHLHPVPPASHPSSGALRRLSGSAWLVWRGLSWRTCYYCHEQYQSENTVAQLLPQGVPTLFPEKEAYLTYSDQCEILILIKDLWC